MTSHLKLASPRGQLLAVVAVGAILSTAGCAANATGNPTPTAHTATTLTARTFVAAVDSSLQTAGSFHLNLTITSQGHTTTADGNVLANSGAGQAATSVTVNAPGLTGARVELLDGIVYLDLGARSEHKYIKIYPDDPSDPRAATLSTIVDETDPAESIQQIKNAILTVAPAGPAAPLDGVEAIPYLVVIESAKLTGGLGSTGASLPPQLDVEYWIGPDDLPRKITAADDAVSEDAEFTNWGENISITTPRADQTTTLAAIEARNPHLLVDRKANGAAPRIIADMDAPSDGRRSSPLPKHTPSPRDPR